jgi:hypothetical protein
MSKMLNTGVTAIALSFGLAAMGSAPAPAASYYPNNHHTRHAGTASSSASRTGLTKWSGLGFGWRASNWHRQPSAHHH